MNTYSTKGKRKRTRFDYAESPSEVIAEILKYALLYLVILGYWELLLYIRTQGTIFGRGLWHLLFLIPISFLLTTFSGWSLYDHRMNRIVTAVIALVVSIYYGSDLIYFESFGSLFSVSMMGMGGDAITNFWWSLSGTILRNIPRLLLYELPVILLFACAFVPALSAVDDILPHKGFKPVFHLSSVAAFFLFWMIAVLILPIGGKSNASVYSAYHSSFVDTDTASKKLGALPNTLVELKSYVFGSDDENGLGGEDAGLDGDGAVTALDDNGTTQRAPVDTSGANVYENLNFAELAEKATTDAEKSLCNYLNGVEPTNKNQYTGMFQGYNLVYICAESFSSYALNEKVTPTLCKLAGEGIVFNNYYNGFKNTTTNGEYTMLTGLWPDVARKALMGSAAGTMPQSATKNMFASLGNMFNQRGIKSRAYHNFKGSYYSRNESWPNIGFDCTFADTGLKISSGWPGSDLEMFQQSVDDYINDDQFCTYYMTFSGHGEYSEKNSISAKNLDLTKKLLGDDAADLTDTDVAYLACHYELDQALKYLLDRLEQSGKMQNTVIVLAADHYPYYLFPGDRNAFTGHNVDKNFEMYQSTLIMWNGGIAEPIQVNTPCDNVDILPTILNLFNFPYDSRLYAGVDVFADNVPHVAQLYNKNFITDRVKYQADSAKATWLDENETATDAEKQEYIDSMIDVVNKRYSMSIAVEDTDFYQLVASNVQIPQHEATATAGTPSPAAQGTNDVASENDGAAENDTSAAESISEDNGSDSPEEDMISDAAEADGAAVEESGEDGMIAEDSMMEEGERGEEIGTDEGSDSKEKEPKKKSGFLGKFFRFILYVILILVLLFVYANRRYFRKRLRRYLRRRRKRRRRH